MNEADDVVWQLLNVDKVTVRGCSDNSVMVHAAEALASPHVRVKTLWLRGGLRVGGAEALGQVLGANTTVEKVMFFGDDDFEEGCMEAMSRCFSVNTTLTDLSFFYCQLGVVDAVSLAKALQVNTSVELLNLTGNAFGNAGATALAELLSRANSKLKELCFIESGIGSAGAAALGRALLVNTNLVTLNLGGNTEIGNAGAIALAPGLAKNTSLKILYVHRCRIQNGGAAALFRALMTNNILEELNLGYRYKMISNPFVELNLDYLSGNFGREDLIAWSKVVSWNTSLSHLVLPEGTDTRMFDGYLQANRFINKYREREHEAIFYKLWPIIYAKLSGHPAALHLLLTETNLDELVTNQRAGQKRPRSLIAQPRCLQLQPKSSKSAL